MIYSLNNTDELKDLDELKCLRSKVKQVGKQGFHYNIKIYLNQSQKQLQTGIQNYLRKLNSMQKNLWNWMNRMII